MMGQPGRMSAKKMARDAYCNQDINNVFLDFDSMGNPTLGASIGANPTLLNPMLTNPAFSNAMTGTF